jgi:hypothetical protein
MRQSTALTVPSPALPDRQALLVELAHLRRRRGGSLIDGTPFDGARRLAEVEQSLLALEDADAVAVQRERGAAGTAEAERVAKLREQISAADSERLAALADAEGAFAFVVERLAQVAALSEQIRVSGAQLQAPTQLPLDPRVIEIRLSQFLVPGLVMLGSSGSFGDIELHLSGGVMERAGQPWPEIERAVSGPSVALLLAGPPEQPPQRSSASFNELSNMADGDSEPEAAADLETVTEGAEQ